MAESSTVLVDDAEPRGASYFLLCSLSAFDEPLSEVYFLKGLGMGFWRWEKELGDLGTRLMARYGGGVAAGC